MASTGGKREGAGRKKGSSNQTRKDLLTAIQENPGLEGYDPVTQMAFIGATGLTRNEYETYKEIIEQLSGLKSKKVVKVVEALRLKLLRTPLTTIELRLNASKEVSQYVYSKRKSIEIVDPDGNNPLKAFAEALAKAAKS